MDIVALAGGVGGAKLAHGLYQALPPNSLSVVVNTGDDFQHFGLHVSPDVDTVCYTLAGLANTETGWGRADESWQAMESAAMLGGPTWFNLGDRDLGTHLERSRRLRAKQSLSQITAEFCEVWGIQAEVLPMSDERVATIVATDQGELAFQDYFVARKCEPAVKGFRFDGIKSARPAPGVIASIEQADFVVICPSNPWVSVDPILELPGVRHALVKRDVVAVSPIIGGQALKGPAAKMYRELGIEASAKAVAEHYGILLSGFVFDQQDAQMEEAIESLGIMTLVTDTIMQSDEDRRRLGQEVLAFGQRLSQA